MLNFDLAWQVALIGGVCGGIVAGGVCWLALRKRREPEIAYPAEKSEEISRRWNSLPVGSIGMYGRRPGLTLLEIIVVIAIITVLVTLTAAMGQYLVRQSAYRASEDILSALDRGTLEYKNDAGIWPFQYDDNGDGAPDNTTQTAVHELTRKDRGGRFYFEGTPQTLPIRDPFTSNRTVYNPTTRGHYQVFTPFEDRGREWYDRPSNTSGWWWDDGIAVDVHGWDRNDWRVQRNHFQPFWHGGGPNGGRREGYGPLDQGNCDDVFSVCFAQ